MQLQERHTNGAETIRDENEIAKTARERNGKQPERGSNCKNNHREWRYRTHAPPLRTLLECAAGRTELLAGLHHARRHGILGFTAPRARIVLLFVAHLAVDLEHAVVITEHVTPATARVNAYWVSVSMFILITPYETASAISWAVEPEPPWNTSSNGLPSGMSELSTALSSPDFAAFHTPC